MNRKERRRQKRENKGNKTINNPINNTFKEVDELAKGLNDTQTKILYEAAQNLAQKQLNEALMAQERVIMAAMLEYLDLDINKADEVFDYAAELLKEDDKKLGKLLKENNEDYNEVLVEINKYSIHVKDRVLQLIGEGGNYLSIKATIMEEFPLISEAMVITILKKIENVYKLKDNYKKLKVNKPKKESKYKILSKEIERTIETDLATYKIKDNILKVGRKAFTDEESISNYYEDEREKLRIKINELTSKIKTLDEKEEEVLEVYEKFM